MEEKIVNELSLFQTTPISHNSLQDVGINERDFYYDPRDWFHMYLQWLRVIIVVFGSILDYWKMIFIHIQI